MWREEGSIHRKERDIYTEREEESIESREVCERRKEVYAGRRETCKYMEREGRVHGKRREVD
jgi:hypothetical protein